MLEELKKQLSEAKQKRDALDLELTALRAERQRLEHELAGLQTKGSAVMTRLKDANSVVGNIEAKIEASKREPRVSDHAVVRYLERKLKLNLDQIRAEILTPDLVEKMVRLGDGKYGMAVVKDRTVVTFLE